MKRILIFVCLCSALTLSAQTVQLKSENRDPKYVETISSRSQKIVDKLGVEEVAQQLNVRNIIANRYFELDDIYAIRDEKVAQAKANLQGSAKTDALKAAEQEKDAALYRSHFAFPAALSLYLSDQQIVMVKDGLTYGVVDVTYTATLDMIPSLTNEEKTQIYAWLVEAREFAMDAENSNKKHEAFGKYKGRINNYLSARGYDLVKEREAWYKRIEERKKNEKK